MKTFALLGFAGAITETSNAQRIYVDFANKQVSPDGLHWTFDLVVKGASTDVIYDGPLNDNWQAINLRLDLEVSNGVTILGGTGVPDPAQANRAAVQTAVPGNPGLNRAEVGFTVTRSGQSEINTSTFTKLATFTVDFSGPVLPTNKVFPRGLSDTRGSSWTNVAGQERRPLTVEGTLMTDEHITLPVSLINFNAKKQEQTVQLTWQTADEANSERFELERSQDGKQWEVIKKVAAAGESKKVLSYSATDEQPFLRENLYRLRMVDVDGTYAYSVIRSVQFDAEEIVLFPNPARDFLTASPGDLGRIASVELFDSAGRKVYVSNGASFKEVRLDKVPAGAYTARITGKNGEIVKQKIVVGK